MPNSGKQKYCSDNCKVYANRAKEAPEKEDAQVSVKEAEKQPQKEKVGKDVKKKVESKEGNIPERDDELQSVIDRINKDFGPGTIFRGGDKPLRVEAISTGSIGLDIATGIGGLPRGRIVEIYGPESGGKTTIALHLIAEAQRRGLKCGIIDAEQSFDEVYARAIGVNVDDLYLNQPDYGEQGLEILNKLVESGKYGVMVVDSVAALTPRAELLGESGDAKMGLHARIMNQACRRVTAFANKNKCMVVFINQIRHKIGDPFQNPEVTTGGNGLKFFASVRLDVRKATWIQDGEVKVGNKVRVKVVKNKCAPPFRTTEFDVVYGEGISKCGEIVDKGVEMELIQKSTSWYTIEGARMQGRDKAIEFLKDNPELRQKLENQIREGGKQ